MFVIKCHFCKNMVGLKQNVRISVDKASSTQQGQQVQFNQATQMPLTNLINDFTLLWQRSNTDFPELEHAYSAAVKRDNEKYLENLLKSAQQNGGLSKGLKGTMAATNEKIAQKRAEFFNRVLRIDASQLADFKKSGFDGISKEFSERAKDFDVQLTRNEIYQAVRNVWTMNCLQLLFGLRVALTPSVFAYSLLYPYTDNFLDDPRFSTEQKIDFNRRFEERLGGNPMKGRSRREEKIYRLVEMIEGEWGRNSCQTLYDSLANIHEAQKKSLQLISANGLDWPGVFEISLEKGGASVVADGYLVAGELTPGRERILFGCGAFLQFVDDLQDIQEDIAHQTMTIFTKRCNGEKLDALAGKTFHFGRAVLRLFDDLYPSPNFLDLTKRITDLLIVESVGRAPHHFSDLFGTEMEKYFPIDFAFLHRIREQFAQHQGSIMGLMTGV
jgi:hypothetical protein